MNHDGEPLPNEMQLSPLLACDLRRHFHLAVLIYQHQLYGLAYGLLGNPLDAEEVVQEAFIRAYQALERYSSEQIETLKLKAWLSTIVLNCSRTALRDQRRRAPSPTVSLDAPHITAFVETRESCLHPSAEEEAITLDKCTHALLQLSTLPIAQREVLSLHFISDLPYSAIAGLLGQSVNTVKSHARRGIQRLNALLEKEGE